MIRRIAVATFVAVLLVAGTSSGARADEVSRAVDRMGWQEMFLETCDPGDADIRLKISVKSEDLKKQLIDLAVRAVRLRPEEKKLDAVFIAPVIITQAETGDGQMLLVEIANATRKNFDLRIKLREGGLEMAKPSLEQTFSARWTRMQDLESEELQVTITMVVGPKREKARPARATEAAPKQPPPASKQGPAGGS
jgi:hypothetical protein